MKGLANGIELCERGLVPDWLARAGMRRLIRRRLAEESLDRAEEQHERLRDRLVELRDDPVAITPEAANDQHYELPVAFFRQVLGRRLKYSSGYWADGTRDLDRAEDAMLALSCRRAELAGGQTILELGCGWGSLTLWMAEHYPSARITAVTNSRSQRGYVAFECARRELRNVEVVTADVTAFETAERFDRVVSIEMFEHLRNYDALLARVAGWLRPGGKLFVHHFCHRDLLYPFDTLEAGDWMGRHFFTGGLMPAETTLLHFQRHLRAEDRWRVCGRHYQRTAEAWLANMDRHRAGIFPVLCEVYGPARAAHWFHRWRMFFMACAELFGYRAGTEWMVSHYRFVRPNPP